MNMQYIKHPYTLLLTLGAVLILSSCSGESISAPVDPTPVAANFRLAAPSTADAVSQDVTRDTELINSWWIVFVKDDKVVKILDRTSTGPVEQEYFNVKLEPGTYDAIAYANITREELTQKTSLTYAIGSGASLSQAKSKSWVLANNSITPGKDLIPMTGYLSGIVISDSEVSETHSIEVVRMAAKIEVQVTNASQKPLTLNAITLGVLNKGSISLMPDYDKLGKQPDILEDSRKSVESVNIDHLEQNIAIGSTGKNIFYVRESDASITHPTGRFYITLKFTRADGAEAEQHYAVTDELQWIQRNDHIVIPVTITDLVLDWNVIFYPPIGGYPAVAKRTEGDDNFFTFGTQGKFAIRPVVRLEDGTTLPAANYDFTITSTEGKTEIFTKRPSKDPLTGEIVGELNDQEGTAVLTCTITVTIDNETQTRVRKIYIIRD